MKMRGFSCDQQHIQRVGCLNTGDLNITADSPGPGTLLKTGGDRISHLCVTPLQKIRLRQPHPDALKPVFQPVQIGCLCGMQALVIYGIIAG